ncbi:MAG: hypothetical protein JST34_08985 [Bacteroidetes bacterium]|jgi:hypothetical protein|nr:hypothetical protein [Bacteroidota bacterium]
MTDKTEIIIDKSKLKSLLRSFITSLIIAIGLIFTISLFGEINTATDKVVYLETAISDIPYFGLNRTYDYGNYFEPAYYNRDINFELSKKIENVALYKLTNFYLPYIFFRNIVLLIGLTFAIMTIKYLIKLIRNKFALKFK